LVAVLLELATDHGAVRERLARMQLADRPDELAAGFKKTLSGWRRSTKFYGYREAGEFGRMLDGWLDQVARELLPKDPPAALALFEAFIEADAAWFDHADDSDSVIGDAVRAACRHWLQAAARCETPADVWPERLLKLYQADQYGARDELLRRANLLLDEPAQRGLVARLESQLAQELEASPRGESPPIDVFRLSGALSLLAESLRDPDIMVRASLRYSPNPNRVQRQAFARPYLRGFRGRDPCPSRTQVGVLGVCERNASQPARRRSGTIVACWPGVRIDGHAIDTSSPAASPWRASSSATDEGGGRRTDRMADNGQRAATTVFRPLSAIGFSSLPLNCFAPS